MVKSLEKFCQVHWICFETVPNSNIFPSLRCARTTFIFLVALKLRNFKLRKSCFFESLGYSTQTSKTAREGWILPVRTAGLPRLLTTQRWGIIFSESLMKSLFQSSEKPVRTFCQMELCNFSTSKIKQEERFPFVGKTGEKFPPNGTVLFYRQIT